MSAANNSSIDDDDDSGANENVTGPNRSGSETDDDDDDSETLVMAKRSKVSDETDDSDSSSGSSSSNDSDDSDSDSSEHSVSVASPKKPIRLTPQHAAILKEKADKLEQELIENPYVYDTYTALVDIYIENDDWWPQLETIFRKFHSIFPLTERYWTVWLDKQKMQISTHNSDDQFDRNSIATLRDLFEKALLDYLSINLWLEYALFGIRFLTADDTRSIFRRALKIAGCHFGEGSKIWHAYKDFEIINIRQLENDSNGKRELALQINDLFIDQLKIPQKNFPKIHNEWLEFKEDVKFLLKVPVPELSRNVSFAGVEQLAIEWQVFEDRLNESVNEIEKFQIYKSYIERVGNEKEYLSSRKKSNILICLLERLVAECCLYSIAWIFYLDFVQKQEEPEDSRKSTMMSIVERAVRNIPYDGSIWAYYLTLMDRFGYTHDQITERFETILTTGFTDGSMYVDVWLAYIEHYRRITARTDASAVDRLQKVFEQALNFVQYYDTECRIARLFAWAQAAYFADLPAMRQTYTSVLNSGANAQKFQFWLELTALERQFGDAKHERKTWIRACDNVRDLRELVATQWLDFEIKYGSADTVLYCRARANQLNFEKLTSSTAAEQKQRKFDANKTNRKQSRTASSSATLKNNSSTNKEPANRKSSVPIAAAAADADAATKPHTNDTTSDSSKASICTLFVKWLPANSTTNTIVDLFRSYDIDANSIRTIIDRKTQKLKNFAYVDFTDRGVAQQAIDELNGKSFGDDEQSTPLFVAFSDPPKKADSTSSSFAGRSGGSYSGQQQSIAPTMPSQRAAKKKLDCALIPTVLKRQKMDEESKTSASGGESGKGSGGKTAQLSNDDFRKRFLS